MNVDNQILIRSATSADRDAISTLYLSAFSKTERDPVAGLAIDLLSEGGVPETCSLVAEISGAIVGHVAFSPVWMESIPNWQGYLLAPLAVSPPRQKHGVGSSIVRHGIGELQSRGVQTLLVYGDPGYYGRFGFDARTAEPYWAPYPLQYAFGWQGLELNDLARIPGPNTIRCLPALMTPALW
ncbi:GNAT family N-acetyltransferase [Thiocapsa bogorovii]|uniref:GNAT family N-acetyltransferase n=1 Tax=Thiocapsa bogorovii TaxID=521689 RepID=UPI001E445579|nr:N-acetyltransferase [Thiocapsa bogorovii]UHD16688.1 N-acetyltransferase [Thiocapsa bogorovii]